MGVCAHVCLHICLCVHLFIPESVNVINMLVSVQSRLMTLNSDLYIIIDYGIANDRRIDVLVFIKEQYSNLQ